LKNRHKVHLAAVEITIILIRDKIILFKGGF